MDPLSWITGITGTLGVAVQSINAIRVFYSSFKDVPKYIKGVIKHIEIMTDVLLGFEKYEEKTELYESQPALVKRCLEACKSATKTLEIAAKELVAAMIGNKIVGRVKSAWSKGAFDRLTANLHSAQMVILLSNQAYMEMMEEPRHENQRKLVDQQSMTLARIEFRIIETYDLLPIYSQITSSSPTPRAVNHGTNSQQRERRRAKQGPTSNRIVARSESTRQKNTRLIVNSSRNENNSVVTIRAPCWLKVTLLAIEISKQKTIGGWELYLHTYDDVSEDSDDMKYVRFGDVVSMRGLFKNKKAHPNDRTVEGITTLGVNVL